MLGSERNPWALHPKEYACAKESWGSGAEREAAGVWGGNVGAGQGVPTSELTSSKLQTGTLTLAC